jgi:LPS-assembly lipoprotein
MSSSDRGRLIRRRAPGLAILLALGLGACTVQPVYGPEPGGGTVKTALAGVAVEQVDDRVAQVVRNRVLFQLTGGDEPATPQYRMHLSVSSKESGLGITSIESSPVYSVSVAATYELKRADTGVTVLKSTARSSASYNSVNQVFANTRAKIDAENRAATQAANEIATRVAAAIAKGL